ncbi:exodeoxyribonuclease VII small subunit [Kamptonema cortianum]|nr:exodeoxyribonuclease VII small subunit [Kamptonema cortianum]
MKKKSDGMKFEEALVSLEKIVEEMESAELPLEEVLQKYEKGIELTRFCTDKLAEAEEKIEFLAQKKGVASPVNDEAKDAESDVEEDREDSLF